MVKLTKIYTKTGDSGTTVLGNSARVAKTHPRVVSYGTVDEANAAIGMAILAAGQPGAGAQAQRIGEVLVAVQHDLFDVGADLCTPITPDERPGQRLRVEESQTLRLEREIDRANESLAPLNSFVLPGGRPLATALHLARTIVRRAEIKTVALAETEPDSINAEAVRYLNRLSDLLFVLARLANDDGKADVLWIPGKNRTNSAD